MGPVENARAVACEVVLLSRQLAFDLDPLRHDFAFWKDRRWIELWRKDELLSSGPAHEKIGTLHYNMQGPISVLPDRLKCSEGVFLGIWSEAGMFEDLDQACGLVKSWLLDRREVDELPSRSVRRYGI